MCFVNHASSKRYSKSALRVLADTNTSIALYKSTSKSRSICINPRRDSLSFFMVDLTYVFKRLSTLNDISAVALATGMVNKTHSFINTGITTMKNDRLSLLGLMHIDRDFEVDLYKAMEVFVSAKTRRADFGQFKEILVYQSH
jgi:hypothetical protein